MRYLIVSEKGRSIGLARRLESEGHSVLLHVVQPQSSGKGNGIVSVVRTPRPLMDSEGVYNLSAVDWLMSTARPDIAIFDSPATATMASKMQAAGYRVLGANSDVEDRALRALRIGSACVEAYFNGQRFIQLVTLISPSYHLFNEDLGPAVSVTGAEARFIDRTDPILPPLAAVEQELLATSYRGPVLIYLSPDGRSVLDFFAGFSEFSVLLWEAISGTVSQLMVDCVNSVNTGHTTLDEHAIMVQLSAPPFPYAAPISPVRIEGIDEGNLKHLWPNDLYRSNEYWTVGESNDIGYVTARGSSAREGHRRAYRTIRNLRADSLQYRTDIGLNRPI